MLKELLNQIAPIATTAIVGVRVVIIKGIGDAAIDFISTKKQEVVNKIGANKYNLAMTTAKDAWNVIEEDTRVSEVIEKQTEQKIAKFAELMKSKFPSISDDEINFIRQSIAGEINKGKVALSSDVVALQNKVAELTNDTTNLINENAQLKQTIANVQSTVKTA